MNFPSIALKTETQQHLKRLLEIISPDDSLLILMHGSPDPDAIASAMALREILARRKNISRCTLAATEPIRRQQNRELAHAMRLTIRQLSQVDAAAYRHIALVDAQPSFFGEPQTRLKPTLVFDHHPRQGDWEAPVADIRPAYGALSTVFTEYLLAARVRIPRNLHTALLYGIKTDTDNFDRDTIAEDIRAYTFHSRRANLLLIRRIELNQTPMSYLKYFDQAFHTMRHFRGRRVGFLGQVESPDVCVQVADFYLHIIGTYYVVVAGIVNDKLVIIFRGDGYRQDCGALAQSACGLVGQGGGHRSAARIEIPLDVLKAELKGDLSHASIDRFLDHCLKRGHAARQTAPIPSPPEDPS
ncbi:MAG: DHH family phosphoesterase [Syntrophaceae bacterium]|jgi:nanoRNase/pAp phosphatase (c-di-AMP/oligoRNAs hydrolase)|nr:DHH family phosphoesterase [Syntrophaceae bacterium]